MNDKPDIDSGHVSPPLAAEQQRRRDFLLGLGRWSKVAIAAAVFGGLATRQADVQAASWVNRRGGVRGGAWVNGGGGGGSWVNRRGVGGWINGR
jgi:hypothetical protein